MKSLNKLLLVAFIFSIQPAEARRCFYLIQEMFSPAAEHAPLIQAIREVEGGSKRVLPARFHELTSLPAPVMRGDTHGNKDVFHIPNTNIILKVAKTREDLKNVHSLEQQVMNEFSHLFVQSTFARSSDGILFEIQNQIYLPLVKSRREKLATRIAQDLLRTGKEAEYCGSDCVELALISGQRVRISDIVGHNVGEGLQGEAKCFDFNVAAVSPN